jgi:hypothetical protein
VLWGHLMWVWSRGGLSGWPPGIIDEGPLGLFGMRGARGPPELLGMRGSCSHPTTSVT